MGRDTLSDVLRAVRLRGAVFYYIDGRLAVGRGGAARGRDHPGDHARALGT